MIRNMRLYNSENYNSINLVQSYFLAQNILVKKENTIQLLKDIVEMVNFSRSSIMRPYIYVSDLNQEYIQSFCEESHLTEDNLSSIYPNLDEKLKLSFKLKLLDDDEFAKSEFSLQRYGMVRFRYRDLLQSDNSYSKIISCKSQLYYIKDDVKNRVLKGLYYHFDLISQERKDEIKNHLFPFIY